jgi:hypothetical protein
MSVKNIASFRFRNALFIPRKFYSGLPLNQQVVLSKIAISTEIEKIYNNRWKKKGVLPHIKVQLQEKVLRGEFPLLEQVKVSHYRLNELPYFQFDRIISEAGDGWCSATLKKECDGFWVYVYEMDRPLLMAVVSILLRNFVWMYVSMPKRLSKITQLHEYHYE